MASFTRILIRQGVISKEQLGHADEVGHAQNISVGDALVSLGYATSEQVMRAISDTCRETCSLKLRWAGS